MDRKSSTRGFTFAELLIVVAIIAVLVAIAIPVFNSQLEKSREATDIANVRCVYAEVMTAAITEDKTATYDGVVMYDSKTDRYIAVVSPLAQKQPKWQTPTPITIGGVSSGADGRSNGLGTWNGEPQPGGSCTIICGRDGAVIFNWGDTDSPTNPDTPDSGNISDSAQDLPSKLDGDKTFQVTKGNIYKFNGKYYVAGATPNEFNQYYMALPDNNDNGWLYIEVDPKNLQSPKTSKDLTNGKATFNIGDVYKTDDGSYYIRHYDNGYRPVDDLDTSANWVKINYTK